MYYRIHSVLGELSYTEGNVHKNSTCQCRLGKGNLMATCPTHFLTSRYYRKFHFSSDILHAAAAGRRNAHDYALCMHCIALI